MLLDILFILFIVFCFLIFKNVKDNNLKYTNFYLLALFIIYLFSLTYIYNLNNLIDKIF